MGAEIAYSREAEAVETAPWPSQKQTPGELCMCLCEANAAAELGSPRGPFPVLDVSYLVVFNEKRFWATIVEILHDQLKDGVLHITNLYAGAVICWFAG